jgi:hypothetical protein
VTSAHTTAVDGGSARIVRELHELIDALDRRTPHAERVDEIAIASAAAALRAEAVERIATLERMPRRSARVCDAAEL